jgi:hypothetical protein
VHRFEATGSAEPFARLARRFLGVDPAELGPLVAR